MPSTSAEVASDEATAARVRPLRTRWAATECLQGREERAVAAVLFELAVGQNWHRDTRQGVVTPCPFDVRADARRRDHLRPWGSACVVVRVRFEVRPERLTAKGARWTGDCRNRLRCSPISLQSPGRTRATTSCSPGLASAHVPKFEL